MLQKLTRLREDLRSLDRLRVDGEESSVGDEELSSQLQRLFAELQRERYVWEGESRLFDQNENEICSLSSERQPSICCYSVKPDFEGEGCLADC